MAKVLLIRFTWLGDVALVSSAAQALVSLGHQVHLLTRKGFGQLYPEQTGITVLEAEPDQGFLDLLRLVRSQEYDAVVDLQAKLLSATITALSRAKTRIVYNKRWWARRAGLWFKRPVEFVPVHHLYCQAALKAVQADEFRCPEPRLLPPEPEFPLPEKFVAIAPGAKHPNRAWPWFDKLSLLLKKAGLEQVWVGLAGQGPEHVFGLDLRGKTSVSQLVAVISKAGVLVSGDTGPMHLARCTQVPVVALFGPTIPEFGFGPLPGQGVVLQKALDCRPCSLHGEKPCNRDLRCLKLIAPGEVFNAITSLL